jgi:hypothetical protein
MEQDHWMLPAGCGQRRHRCELLLAAAAVVGCTRCIVQHRIPFPTASWNTCGHECRVCLFVNTEMGVNIAPLQGCHDEGAVERG